MSKEKYNQNLIVGAAVVAGILGTLSALVRSNRASQGWTERAKDIANHMLEKGEAVNKNMLLGGVAGGLIGATTALMLAPKAGLDLIKDIVHPFSEQKGNTRSTSRKSTKSNSRKKGAVSSTSAKNHPGHQHKEGIKRTEKSKTNKSSTKKKNSSRRRTAAIALKQAAEHPEKVISEVAT